MQIIDERSERRLSGCHPDLQRVVRRAYTLFPEDGTQIIITCGQRSIEEQKKLVAAGFSKTMRSRHIPDGRGYSHAVDFAVLFGGKPRWDWPPFSKIAKAMKEAAKAEKVPIEWGGDWKGGFVDGPHFQLPWKSYPAKGTGLGLLTVSEDEPEPKSDIIGNQAAALATLGALDKPASLNRLWGLVSSGGVGGLAFLSGWDWRAMLVLLAFLTVWGGIAVYLYRDKLRGLFAPADDL